MFIINNQGKVEYKRPSVKINNLVVTKEDGGIIPNDGVDEGTKLKIEFEVNIERGNVLQVSPGTLQNGKVIYITQGNEKQVIFTITSQIEGKTYDDSKTISVESYYKKLIIGQTVKRGDYVNYTLGNWTNADIAKLGNLYYGTGNPPDNSNMFGGFGVGSRVGGNKDYGVNPTEWRPGFANGTYLNGWRVLNINSDGTINIIHAEAPEKFNYTPWHGMQENYENFFTKTRDWSMYEDCSTDSVDTNYAIRGSGRCVSKQELIPLQSGQYNLTHIGYNYYIIGGDTKNTRINGTNGERFLGIGYTNYIRPVVTLKAEIIVKPKDGQTTHVTPETAWELEL